MEVLSSRKSYDLLEDKEFVALMFQCRDKFMGLVIFFWHFTIFFQKC